jgi:hypothetical protein
MSERHQTVRGWQYAVLAVSALMMFAEIAAPIWIPNKAEHIIATIAALVAALGIITSGLGIITGSERLTNPTAQSGYSASPQYC